jgi:hypothetical protein
VTTPEPTGRLLVGDSTSATSPECSQIGTIAMSPKESCALGRMNQKAIVATAASERRGRQWQASVL